MSDAAPTVTYRTEEKGPYGLTFVRLDFTLGAVENFTLTSVSGGGGGAMPFAIGGIQPIKIRGSSTNFHRAYVPTPEGKVSTLTLEAQNTPMAQGFDMSLVWATRDGKDPVMVAAENRSTGQRTTLHGPWKKGDNPANASMIATGLPSFTKTFLTLSVILGALMVGLALLGGAGQEGQADVIGLLVIGPFFGLLFAAFPALFWWMFKMSGAGKKIDRAAMAMIEKPAE